jgi:hypothetical protein
MKALIIVALYFSSICASVAQEESGTFNFLWENDTIAGTDHHYTNGVELSYLSIEDRLWDWFRNGSNLFLDGEASTYDVVIQKETFVYDAQAGFAVLWRKLRFAYTYVIRSKEFEGQEQPDRFGSGGLTFRF